MSKKAARSTECEWGANKASLCANTCGGLRERVSAEQSESFQVEHGDGPFVLKLYQPENTGDGTQQDNYDKNRADV